MEKILEAGSSIAVIRDLIRSSESGSTFDCSDAEVFESAKVALVAEKAVGITVRLLDEEGYIVRQVCSRRRSDEKKREQFTDRQLSVIRALEKVLAHCQKEGIQLIGFSDELVAQPMGSGGLEGVSASALDVDTCGIYKGADAIKRLL